MPTACKPIIAPPSSWLSITDDPLDYDYPTLSIDEENGYDISYPPTPETDLPAAALTSVHPPQTTVVDIEGSLLPESSIRPDVAFRFSAQTHRFAFDRTLEVLRSTPRHFDRAKRLELCGAHATVWHSPSTDTVSVRSYHCGMRCCPRCRETHSARTRETLNRFLANVDPTHLSFLTFTLVHTDDALHLQIDHLYASFRRLRASKTWKSARPRGFAVLEITRSTTTNQWHPHLHVLAEMPFLPQHQLRDAWLHASLTSCIVDIRRVNRHSIDRHRDYLCAYLTKPAATDVLDSPALLLEWVDSFLHRKVLLKFGQPTLADQPLPPTDPGDWSLIGSLIGLLAGRARRNPRAIAWLARIGKGPTREQRDPDAGKDYSIDPAYRTETAQFY